MGRHSIRARRGLPGRRWVGWLLRASAVTAGLALGTTMAYFSASTLFHGGTIGAGDLNLGLGTMTWKQVTPGVTNGASGTLTDTPASFVSMPGDVVEIQVPVTTYLRGDNLTADMTVVFDSPDAAAGKIVATFVILDDAGAQVAPTSGVGAANTTLTVPGLLGTNTGVIGSWTVVLRVEVLGDYQWATPQDTPTVEWSAGVVQAHLHQVRPGIGGGP